MGTSKKKPTQKTKAPLAPGINGATDEVLTGAEAAAYLRIREDEIHDLVHAQNLPGRFTGTEWRFLKSAIRLWLSTAAPTPQDRKDAQLALAGKYKDDPDLLRICEDAYRERGRPADEDD